MLSTSLMREFSTLSLTTSIPFLPSLHTTQEGQLQYTVKKVLADYAFLTDDATAKLYVTQSFVK